MKSLKCPNCGAGLSLNSTYAIVMECPYCHTQVINERSFQSKDNSVEPNVLPFHMKEEEVMESFVNHLLDLDDSPSDVFAKMHIASVKKYYLPMYIFQGTFRAPWTAKVPRKQKKQRINSSGEIKDDYDVVYDYPHGEAVGNFSFNSIPEEEANRLGIDIDYLQDVDINPSELVPLSSVNIVKDKRVEILPPAGNADIVWSQYAEQMAIDEAYAAAQAQCPQPSFYSFLYKSEIVSCSASCEMRKASLVFIPIWRIDYKYQDGDYFFISYANQENMYEYLYPQVEPVHAQATEEQQALLDAYESAGDSNTNIIGGGCLLLLTLEICTVFGFSSFFEHLREENFGWYFPLAAIPIILIYYLLEERNKSKYDIEEINADIASRTENMLNDALDYKKQTGHMFLQNKSWNSNNSFDTSSEDIHQPESIRETTNQNNSPIVSQPLNNNSSRLTPLYEDVRSNTKYCIHCGKEIDSTHRFCKYCGSKQK